MADRTAVIQGLIELHMSGQGGEQAVTSMKAILAEAKQLQPEMDKFAESTKKGVDIGQQLEGVFLRVGERIVAAFAIERVADFIRGSVLEFAKLERTVAGIDRQLSGLGQGEHAGKVMEFVEALSRETGALDKDLVPAFQRALIATNDFRVASEITTIATKLAAAGWGDIGGNVERISRALQTGMVRGLVDLGIHTKEGEEKILSFNEIAKLLEKQVALVGGEFHDTQRDIDDWKRRLEEAEIATGKFAAGAIKSLEDLGTKLGGSFLFFSAEDQKKIEQGGAEIAAQMLRDKNAANKKAADEKTALDEYTAKKDAELAAKNARLKAEEAQKLDLKNAEETLKAEAALYEKGSAERYRIELELLEREKAAAIKAAQEIGASQAKAAAQFKPREQALSKAFDDTSGSEPSPALGAKIIAEHAEIERLEQGHQARMAAIENAGTEEGLNRARDYTLKGTGARIQAEEALARASLQKKVDQEIAANAKILESDLKMIRSSTAAGIERDNLETEAAKKHAEEVVAIKRNQADEEYAITLQSVKWSQEAGQQQANDIESAATRTGSALAQIFDKHKGFAIGMAIMQTSSAIMDIWADPNGGAWYVKLAKTIAMAAEGAAQIKSIQSASVTGGGSIAAGYGTSAPSPSTETHVTVGATQTTVPIQQSVGGSSSTGSGMAAMSPSTLSAMAGRGGGSSAATVVNLNIRNAFGDRAAMSRLTTEIQRVLANQQSVLR